MFPRGKLLQWWPLNNNKGRMLPGKKKKKKVDNKTGLVVQNGVLQWLTAPPTHGGEPALPSNECNSSATLVSIGC